jgi:superfamily II DNA or RNA helicase
MVNLHPKSSRIAATGLLTGVQCFGELEERIDALPEEAERGDAFEVFASAWLALFSPEPPTEQYFWPLAAELGKRLGVDPDRDRGIDAVMSTAHGLTTVQFKYRRGRPDITWGELATFYGLSEKANFRLVVSNGYGMAETATTRGRTGFIGAELFDELTAADFARIAKHIERRTSVAAPHEAQPHQSQAVMAVRRVLRECSRTQVLMACGTGKTLVGSILAGDYACVLVLVPSLSLIRQHLSHWAHEGRLAHYSPLVVCSDETSTRGLTAEGAEDCDIEVADLGIAVSTEVAAVRQHLEASARPLVLFCTYHSTPILAQALPVGFVFDLALFDEAHRTAGRRGSRFAMALDDAHIPAKKRAFFTATPRVFAGGAQDSSRVYSMDDEAVYGPVAYELGFRDAAALGLIRDYRIIISVVTQEMVNGARLRLSSVDIAGESRLAYDVACHLAIAKSMKLHGLRKGMAFFSRTSAARRFADPVATSLYEGEDIRLDSVQSRGMTGAARARRLHEFAISEHAILANARCLSEGVDVPSVDFVAFMAPKSSYVDIVQIVGRALRRYEGKPIGYVILPIFVEEHAGESLLSAVARAGFNDIWNVIEALRTQDPLMDTFAREAAARHVAGLPPSFRDIGDRIFIDGVSSEVSSLEQLDAAIAVRIVSPFVVGWDVQYAKLRAFQVEHGHTFVTDSSSPDTTFVNWVSWHRNFGSVRLTDDRRAALDAIGFVWDVPTYAFERMSQRFVAFRTEFGHSDVPYDYGTDEGIPGASSLGKWVYRQRSLGKNGRLSGERRAQLEAVDFPFDPARDVQLERMLVEIEEAFRKGAPTPETTRTVNYLRHRYLSGFLTTEQWARLVAVGAPVDTIRTQISDEEGLAELGVHFEKVHHCLLDKREVALAKLRRWLRRAKSRVARGDAALAEKLAPYGVLLPERAQFFLSLARWLSLIGAGGLEAAKGDEELKPWRATLRARHRKGRLTAETLAYLQAAQVPLEADHPLADVPAIRAQLGLPYIDPRTEGADAAEKSRIEARETFMAGSLTLERIRLSLSAALWPHVTKDYDWVQALVRHADEGTLNDPGEWPTNQRAAVQTGRLASHRVTLLRALEFDFDVIPPRWGARLAELKEYRATHDNWPTQDLSIGKWITSQRKLRPTLNGVQLAELDALGFDWDPNGSHWERRIGELRAFYLKHGHSRVPQRWTENNPLATFVQGLRSRAGSLSNEQKAVLAEVAFQFEVQGDAWEVQFESLLAYKALHGHVNVPAVCAQDPQLGTWVHRQRSRPISQERRARLLEMGFDFNGRDASWKECLSEWQEMARTDTLSATRKVWANQVCRDFHEGTLEPWQIELLQATNIPFETARPRGSDMERLRLKELEAFHTAHAHVELPNEGPTRSLAAWVRSRRILWRKGKLPANVLEVFEKLGLAADNPDAQWEAMYAQLEAYVEAHGTTAVPVHSSGKLGNWVFVQRRCHREGKLSENRRAKLNALNFIWRLSEGVGRPRKATEAEGP